MLIGDINMIESDNKSDVYIIQLYKEGTVYNLTGKTIELNILEKRRKYGDTFTLPVYEATQGKIKLEVVEGMTKTDGLFYFQITVKDGKGLVDNFPIFPVEIKNSIKDDIIGAVVAGPYMQILLDAVTKAENAVNLVEGIEDDYKTVKKEIQTDYAKVKEGIQKDYDSLQQIMIDENQAADLQAQINKSNEQLDTIENHTKGKVNIYDYSKLFNGNDIQKALDKIYLDFPNGCTIFIPGGTYKFEQIKSKRYFDIIGEENKTILQAIKDDVSVIHANKYDDESLSLSYCRIENIIFEGLGKTQTQVALNASGYLTYFKNVTFKNFYKGMIIRGTFIDFENCKFINNNTALEIGYSNPTNKMFSNLFNLKRLYFESNNIAITQTSDSLNSDMVIVGLSINGCVFANNGTPIILEDLKNGEIINSWFEGNTNKSVLKHYRWFFARNYTKNDNDNFSFKDINSYDGIVEFTQGGGINLKELNLTKETSSGALSNVLGVNNKNLLISNNKEVVVNNGGDLVYSYYININEKSSSTSDNSNMSTHTNIISSNIEITKLSLGVYQIKLLNGRSIPMRFSTLQINSYNTFSEATDNIPKNSVKLYHSDPASYRDYWSVNQITVYCTDKNGSPINAKLSILINTSVNM